MNLKTQTIFLVVAGIVCELVVLDGIRVVQTSSEDDKPSSVANQKNIVTDDTFWVKPCVFLPEEGTQVRKDT